MSAYGIRRQSVESVSGDRGRRASHLDLPVACSIATRSQVLSGPTRMIIPRGAGSQMKQMVAHNNSTGTLRLTGVLLREH